MHLRSALARSKEETRVSSRIPVNRAIAGTMSGEARSDDDDLDGR